MDTIKKGNAAEAAVLLALIDGGIGVLIPFGGGAPVDLVAVTPPDGDLVRIQVKSGRIRKGCVEFNSSSTDHGKGQLPYTGRADLIAVHVREISETFAVPVDDCAPFRGYLRVDEPRKNQRRGIRFAADYTLDNWLQSLGSGVANAQP
jgi:hypothetical protein